MRKPYCVACAVAAACYCIAASFAVAETTVLFSGHVDDVPDTLTSQFQPDMPMTGTYTFDESLALADFLGSVTAFEMTIGDYTVQQSGLIRGDITSAPTAYVAVSIVDGATVGDNATPFIAALQFSSSAPVFDASSPFPPPLENVDTPLWTLDFNTLDATARLSGTVESVVIPEPSALVLGLMGLMAVVAGRRRRP